MEEGAGETGLQAEQFHTLSWKTFLKVKVLLLEKG